jgi:uncharacterized protein (DUF1778 family)
MTIRLENRIKNINFRVKPSELELLNKRASECGMRLSDFIRKQIL